MLDRPDLEHGRDVSADLVYIRCTRTVGTVQGPSLRPLTPMSPHVQELQGMLAVRCLCCPYGSGRLWLRNREDIHVVRRSLTAAELRRQRRRPAKIGWAS
jgi:hypothetical protein